jgi:hypothetical protein
MLSRRGRAVRVSARGRHPHTWGWLGTSGAGFRLCIQHRAGRGAPPGRGRLEGDGERHRLGQYAGCTAGKLLVLVQPRVEQRRLRRPAPPLLRVRSGARRPSRRARSRRRRARGRRLEAPAACRRRAGLRSSITPALGLCGRAEKQRERMIWTAQGPPLASPLLLVAPEGDSPGGDSLGGDEAPADRPGDVDLGVLQVDDRHRFDTG